MDWELDQIIDRDGADSSNNNWKGREIREKSRCKIREI